MVLQKSYQPLTLKRIPPNLLVGEGATDFAFENNIPVLPHDALVSPAARQRWLKWKEDLRNAASAESNGLARQSADDDLETSLDLEERDRKLNRLQHTRAMEGQGLLPINPPGSKNWKTIDMRSPAPSLCLSNADSPRTPGSPRQDVDLTMDSPVGNGARYESDRSPPVDQDDYTSVVLPQLPGHIDSIMESPSSRNGHGRTAVGLQGSRAKVNGSRGYDGTDDDPLSETVEQELGDRLEYFQLSDSSTSRHANGPSRDPSIESVGTVDENQPFEEDIPPAQSTKRRDDHITDTVGAIAIDSNGRIAAGSSSGGIGMKYPGRVGPAALVGVGTTVIPEDPSDEDKISVAAVTSGTGEHITTTMAAATCANRLYHCVRPRGAGKMEYVSEDEAIRSVIERDFMGELILAHCSKVSDLY